jgi:hypothetical protein
MEKSVPALSAEAESTHTAITPMEFVVLEDEGGRQRLDVQDAEFEQSYGIRDQYARMLFVALCHREGLKSYRHRRQHTSTVCVKTTLKRHEALWTRFLALNARLEDQLVQFAQRFVRAEVDRT